MKGTFPARPVSSHWLEFRSHLSAQLDSENASPQLIDIVVIIVRGASTALYKTLHVLRVLYFL